MNPLEPLLQHITEQLGNIRHDLFALTSAVQNQPLIDRDRLEQDFLAARNLLSPSPFPPETDTLLKVLSIRDKATPPRALKDRLREPCFAPRDQNQPE